MTQRTERVDELLRQEIGRALEREITDPRIGFVTVTDVETVPDLSRARVWVSIIGTAEEKKEALTALRRAMPFLRHLLGKRIDLRRIPELEVKLDESNERGSRVLRILNELEAGNDPGVILEPVESLPTPVRRIRHEGDLTEEPASAVPVIEPAAVRRARRARTSERPVGPGKGKPGDKSRSAEKPVEKPAPTPGEPTLGERHAAGSRRGTPRAWRKHE